MQFRKSINALRALAVLSVVLFISRCLGSQADSSA